MESKNVIVCFSTEDISYIQCCKKYPEVILM